MDGTGNPGPVSNQAHASASAGTGIAFLQGTLAYQVQGDVRVRTLPGLTPEQTIGQGLKPKFGGDGQRVYYAQTNKAAIVSAAADGTPGAPQPYYSAQGLTEQFDVAASPNFFAVIASRRVFDGVGGFCDAFEPDYRSITPAQSLDDETSSIANNLALSADRRWLAFSYTGFCNATALHYLPATAFCIVRLAGHVRTCATANYEQPAFSPDGEWVAFTATFSGQRELWKAHVEASGALSNLTQLTRARRVSRPPRRPGRPMAAIWFSSAMWTGRRNQPRALCSACGR